MNASDLAKTQSAMVQPEKESDGFLSRLKEFATTNAGAGLLGGLGAGLIGSIAGVDSGEAFGGGLQGGVQGMRRLDQLDQEKANRDLAQQRIAQTENAYNMPKGEFGYLLGLNEQDPVKQALIRQRLGTIAKDPFALQQQQYASQYGAGLGKLETAGQIESAKTMGREQAQMGLERQEGAKASQGRVNTIDSLIRDVEQNPNVVGIYSPLKETAGRLTGGRVGFNEQQLQDRGNLVRGIGQMQNEILAAARAAGQSGINTISEIRQATKGINENSSPEELIGALQRMRESETRLNERLSGGQQASGSKYKVISVR